MTPTHAQLRAIHAAARAQGIDDDAYRDRLRAHAGVASAKDLSRAQASAFLADLGVPLEARPRPRTHPGDGRARRRLPRGAVRLQTPAQRRLIADLVDEVRWDGPDAAEHYRRWLRGSLGLARVRTSTEARAAIEGLKGLKRTRAR